MNPKPLPDHFFVDSSTGDLYDTRLPTSGSGGS